MVIPGRSPRSIWSWRTHLRNAAALTPSCTAAVVMGLPARTRATTRRRNSAGNGRGMGEASQRRPNLRTVSGNQTMGQVKVSIKPTAVPRSGCSITGMPRLAPVQKVRLDHVCGATTGMLRIGGPTSPFTDSRMPPPSVKSHRLRVGNERGFFAWSWLSSRNREVCQANFKLRSRRQRSVASRSGATGITSGISGHQDSDSGTPRCHPQKSLVDPELHFPMDAVEASLMAARTAALSVSITTTSFQRVWSRRPWKRARSEVKNGRVGP